MPEPHPPLIHCAQHGVSPYGIICRHLRDENRLGYLAIRAEGDEPAQAWCEACDTVLEEEQGWTDRADLQADWKLYCTVCYETTLRRHRLRSWVEGTSPESPQDW
jgi:hypothetical protein